MMRALALLVLFSAPAFAEVDTTSLAYTRAYPLASRGYALIKEGRTDEAIVMFERAVELTPDNAEYRQQLEILLAQKRAAETPIETAAPIEETPQDVAIPDGITPPTPGTVTRSVPTTQTAEYKRRQRFYDFSAQAYAHRKAGENQEAIADFAEALEAQDDMKLRQDYAFTLKDEGMREGSAAQLTAVLDDIADDADKHYAYRREIQQLQDNWTSVGSITYRDGLARASGIPGLQNYNESLQYGLETVYSPDSLQRNGQRLLQLYGQAFASSNNRQYDFNDNTTQGAVGARTMLVPDVEWYLYGARLFRIGSQAINDWQLRTTYSYTQGFDIDPNRDEWFYLFATPDISYLTDREELFASFEGRIGQSYRFDDWVVTPHIVGAAAHNHNNIDSRDSIEYGPGVSVKYWFDESASRAPTGSGELIFQWREAVGPSEDKSGPFVRFVLQY